MSLSNLATHTHFTTSVFSSLNNTVQRKLYQNVFEAAFHGYTKALEMMLSQFGVPVNIKNQKVSAWLNCFYTFTPT